jgi:hypothetical protein
MPSFIWTGNQADDGTPAELFRVYIFTDKQCINRVFTGGVVGSPAYSPRPFGGLSLPVGSLGQARSVYLPDGTEPPGYTYDGEQVDSSESAPMATPTTTLPADTAGGSAAPAEGTSDPGNGSGTLDWGTSKFGAPTDLWDVDWPQGGYYWTVIPVAAISPGALLTNVAPPGGPATATSLPVTQSDGFAAGDTVTVGNAGNSEPATITSVSDSALTFASALKFNHGPGEPINRTGGSLRYTDLEMAEDVCRDGRVARFGKNSEPSLTASGDIFASGLSPTGRLASAVHTASFYKSPLVSWTPALGAMAYEIQWSKKGYPFDPKTGGKRIVTATSYVLPLVSGTWYYRVRGYDYSLPTGVQQMSWSDPAKIEITRPTFTVVGATPTKKKTAAAKSGTAVTKTYSTSAYSITVPSDLTQFPPAPGELGVWEGGGAAVPRIKVVTHDRRGNKTYSQYGAAYVSLLHQVAVAAGDPSGVTGVSVTSVHLPAGPAELVRYHLLHHSSGRWGAYSDYILDNGKRAVVLSFETTVGYGSPFSAKFARAAASFRLK